MAVIKNHAELGLVKKNGDVDILYLKNQGRDVEILRDNNAKLPTSINTAQDLADKLNDLAFSDGENLVYIGEGEIGSGTLPPLSEVDDSKLSITSTWSSQKIYDSYNKFISNYEIGNGNKIDVLTKLFTTPVVFIVDTEQWATLKNYTPNNDMVGQWIVHYYPLSIDAHSVEGAPGAPNTPRIAYQDWIFANNSTDTTNARPLHYKRVYIGGNWNNWNDLQ